MKFLSFIASTMLIVLISQHSIMGLPVTDAPVEDHCSEGFELVDGRCHPILSTTSGIETRTLSVSTEIKIAPLKNVNACPPGTQRGESGGCEQIQRSESTTVNDELTTPHEDDKHNEVKTTGCKEGFAMIDDQCMPIVSTTSGDATTSSQSPVTMLRTKEFAVTDSTITSISGSCAEGKRHGKNGICEDITTSETTTVRAETTTVGAETTSAGINFMDCPGGLKRGDDGFCPEMNPVNRTASVNPQGLLKPDGSCPDNYVKVKDRCLFVRPQPDQSLNGDDSNSAQSRIGKDEVNSSELVPVELGNLCPKGTENFSTGLCRKRPASSDAGVDTNGDRICPSDYDSIDGNCVPKDNKDGSRFSTSTTAQESTTTRAEEPVEQKKVPESTPESTTRAEKPVEHN